MIEDSRQQKKEYLAMRLEDKYTEETDPVESFERRAKRLNDKWKEEHASELKDDARERAEKGMRAEKEQEQREREGRDDEASGDEQPATHASREAEAESGDTGAPGELEAPENGKKVVDNRKLVYDDIWDETRHPMGRGQAPEPEKKPKDNRKLVYHDIWGNKLPDEVADEPLDKSSSPEGPPKSMGPAVVSGGVVRNADGEVFMPWADGAVGMDAVAQSREVLEKRKAALQAAKASETGEADTKPSWHSKYLEQVAKSQGKLNSAAPASKAFAPPPRTAQAPAAPVTEEMGAGELDEMD